MIFFTLLRSILTFLELCDRIADMKTSEPEECYLKVASDLYYQHGWLARVEGIPVCERELVVFLQYGPKPSSDLFTSGMIFELYDKRFKIIFVDPDEKTS